MFIGTCWREATPAVAVALVKSRRRRRLSFLCSRWLPLHLSRQTRSAGTRLPAKVDTCIRVNEYMYESVAGERERERGSRCPAALRLRRGKHMAPSARRPDPLTGAPSRERSSPSERASERERGREGRAREEQASERGGRGSSGDGGGGRRGRQRTSSCRQAKGKLLPFFAAEAIHPASMCMCVFASIIAVAAACVCSHRKKRRGNTCTGTRIHATSRLEQRVRGCERARGRLLLLQPKKRSAAAAVAEGCSFSLILALCLLFSRRKVAAAQPASLSRSRFCCGGERASERESGSQCRETAAAAGTSSESFSLSLSFPT